MSASACRGVGFHSQSRTSPGAGCHARSALMVLFVMDSMEGVRQFLILKSTTGVILSILALSLSAHLVRVGAATRALKGMRAVFAKLFHGVITLLELRGIWGVQGVSPVRLLRSSP